MKLYFNNTEYTIYNDILYEDQTNNFLIESEDIDNISLEDFKQMLNNVKKEGKEKELTNAVLGNDIAEKTNNSNSLDNILNAIQKFNIEL